MAFLIRHASVRRPSAAALAAPLVLLLFAGAGARGRAEGVELLEQKVKAGLICNLLKYVDWPEESGAAPEPSVVICIFGNDPFGGSLDPLAQRTVNQRRIEIRRVDAIAETQRCHLLFVNANEHRRWTEISAFLAGKSVLTVSDFEAFVGSGGMVEFTHQDQHIAVSIDMTAVSAAGLRVHDRLLNLARVVPTRN